MSCMYRRPPVLCRISRSNPQQSRTIPKISESPERYVRGGGGGGDWAPCAGGEGSFRARGPRCARGESRWARVLEVGMRATPPVGGQVRALWSTRECAVVVQTGPKMSRGGHGGSPPCIPLALLLVVFGGQSSGVWLLGDQLHMLGNSRAQLESLRPGKFPHGNHRDPEVLGNMRDLHHLEVISGVLVVEDYLSRRYAYWISSEALMLPLKNRHKPNYEEHDPKNPLPTISSRSLSLTRSAKKPPTPILRHPAVEAGQEESPPLPHGHNIHGSTSWMKSAD